MTTIQVLIVEDNPLAQKMAALAMRTLGCKVDTADNGQTALEKHANQIYDLILMDIGLPHMDGHEVTVKIRKREKENNRHTPIVALTAHSDEEQKAKALASGMDGFLGKPLTPPIAQEILNRYVKKS